MTKRILFYKTRKNANSLASLVGAIEVAQGRTVVRSAPAPRPALPDLSGWEVGFFGPAGRSAQPALDAALTVLAFSFMTIDRPEIEAALAALPAPGGGRVVAIAGGAHASGDPAGTLVLGFAHAFVGEGELTLPAFLDRLAKGDTSPPVLRPDHAPLPLDAFLSFALFENLLAPIELGRGCPFACRFCHVPGLQGRRMRHRSVESVLEHVEHALARGRVRTWFVTSDAFAYGSAYGEQGDARACERLLKGCRDAGMKEVFWGGFPSEVRPDHVQDELLELVTRYCANRTIVIGAQSGSDEVLSRLSRGHLAGVVLGAVKKVKAHGLVPHVDFILGLPGETLAERRLTMDLVEAIAEVHGGKVHMHYFMPHPGTPYADAQPQAVEDEILARVERLTGKQLVDGYWRRQREVAARANPDVMPVRSWYRGAA